MRVLLLLLTACWTSPPAPSTPTARNGTCVIRDHDVIPQDPIELRSRGTTFAKLSELERFDVTVVADRATAIVETSLVELEGEVPLDRVSVRPAVTELRDGWLEITFARGTQAIGDTLRIQVTFAGDVEPRTRSFDVPCRELTFTAPAEEPSAPDSARHVDLARGAVAKLSAVPGGPIVATLRRPDGEGFDGTRAMYVLETRGTLARIRIGRPNAIVAWTEAASLVDQTSDLYGGLLGDESGTTGGYRLQCTKAVPLYLRVGDEVLRVGRLKPHVSFQPYTLGTGDIEIDLDATVKPFIKHADAEVACKR